MARRALDGRARDARSFPTAARRSATTTSPPSPRRCAIRLITQGPASRRSRRLRRATRARARGRVRRRHRRAARRRARGRARARRRGARAADHLRRLGELRALPRRAAALRRHRPRRPGTSTSRRGRRGGDRRTKARRRRSRYAGLPVDLDAARPLRERGVDRDRGRLPRARRRTATAAPVGGPGGADMTVLLVAPGQADDHRRGRRGHDRGRRARRARLRRFRTHGIARERTSPRPARGAWHYDDGGARLQLPDHRLPVRARAQPAASASTAGSSAATRSPRATASALAGRGPDRAAAERAPEGSLPRLPPVRDPGPRRRRAARCAAFERLRERGIGVQVHYIPVYSFCHYRETLGYPQDDAPRPSATTPARSACRCSRRWRDADVDRVVEELGRRSRLSRFAESLRDRRPPRRARRGLLRDRRGGREPQPRPRCRARTDRRRRATPAPTR